MAALSNAGWVRPRASICGQVGVRPLSVLDPLLGDRGALGRGREVPSLHRSSTTGGFRQPVERSEARRSTDGAGVAARRFSLLAQSGHLSRVGDRFEAAADVGAEVGFRQGHIGLPCRAHHTPGVCEDVDGCIELAVLDGIGDRSGDAPVASLALQRRKGDAGLLSEDPFRGGCHGQLFEPRRLAVDS